MCNTGEEVATSLDEIKRKSRKERKLCKTFDIQLMFKWVSTSQLPREICANWVFISFTAAMTTYRLL